MRLRTAKQRAERIDLYYFTRATGMRRWRYVLSAAVPLAVALWVSVGAAGGSRKAYSAGPVSTAHAFAELRCEVCHAKSGATLGFRAHTTEKACLTCHDAPTHAANMTPAPACAACHQEHRGRVAIATTDDRFCVQCHGALQTTTGTLTVAGTVGGFPDRHPEFAASGANREDPGRIRFNHAVHLKEGLRGPQGAETLACASCHQPQAAAGAARPKRAPVTGLMAPIAYAQHCARCHTLFFDERIETAAPHAKPAEVRAFVMQALVGYIQANPGDVSTPESGIRRIPLNFPRAPEPPARNAAEWVSRRAAADERILWNKTCVECHERETAAPAADGLPVYAASQIPARWMPRAAFDHAPHRLVRCQDCHAADASARTSDVLMPTQAVCASCHSATGRAESRCFECHRYHDWAKSHPVAPSFSVTDFK